MRRRVLALSFLLAATAVASVPAEAAATPKAITGIFLTTPYPAMTVRAGAATTLDLSAQDFDAPPQPLTLSVPVLASGWTASILGGGQPVGAVFVAPKTTASLQLRLQPPAEAGPGDYRFTVEAKGDAGDFELPITITIAKALPAKLKLTTSFPSLRGTSATAFKYTVKVANDSGRDATINLAAAAPKDFQVTFTQAYGTQQITSLPIAAGKSKEIDAAVAMPQDTTAGTYRIVLHAKSSEANADIPVELTVVGQPKLMLTGEGERLSGTAYAGEASVLTLVLSNDGGAAAHDIGLRATTPDGWTSTFSPKSVAALPAGRTQRVKLTLTPSHQAIAGDYQTTIDASGADGLSQSANFRITVLTSTLWGTVGVAVILIALVVVVFAVGRFGRR